MKNLSAIPDKPRPSTWALVLAFGVVYLSWGTTYFAIKIGVKEEALPPALFGGTRLFLAGWLILGYLALRGQSLRLSRQQLSQLFLVSAILFVGGNGLIHLAETTVPSGVAAVLAATTPLWIALAELLWPGGERCGLRGWCGLILGLGGVCLLLAPKWDDTTAWFGEVGPLLVLGSAASWGFGSVLARHRKLPLNPLTSAAYQLLLGGGMLALVGLICGEVQQLPEQWTARAVGAYFYLLIVGSLMGFVAFNWLLSHVSATQVGTYAYVNPVVAVLLAWATDEHMTIWIVSGIGVILASVALVRSSIPLPPVPEPTVEECPVLRPQHLAAAPSES